mmetsp:Transcript_9371/g.21353  ORF Transcript_9371/g.21353 Transcript_9371/m.21353 type:complete len:244 (-) Transcript_9371:161-892(-)
MLSLSRISRFDCAGSEFLFVAEDRTSRIMLFDLLGCSPAAPPSEFLSFSIPSEILLSGCRRSLFDTEDLGEDEEGTDCVRKNLRSSSCILLGVSLLSCSDLRKSGSSSTSLAVFLLSGSTTSKELISSIHLDLISFTSSSDTTGKSSFSILSLLQRLPIISGRLALCVGQLRKWFEQFILPSSFASVGVPTRLKVLMSWSRLKLKCVASGQSQTSSTRPISTQRPLSISSAMQPADHSSILGE